MVLSSALIIVKKESKRLPNKNTLSFRGKPMFLWNVDKCLAIFNKTYVSSEDQEILKLATDRGAIPIKRPKRLCGDTPNIPVYQHAYKKMGSPDAIVAVQANSPTVRKKQIRLAKEIMETGNWKEVMTCYEDHLPYGSIWAMNITRLMEYKNPYKPIPELLFVDKSIDIHTEEDFKKAEQQQDDELRHLNNNSEL